MIDGIASRDDAKLWIGRNQLGRRNLTDFQRVELALMMKPIIEGKARANQLSAQNNDAAKAVRQNSDEQITPIRTDDAVADMALSASSSTPLSKLVPATFCRSSPSASALDRCRLMSCFDWPDMAAVSAANC